MDSTDFVGSVGSVDEIDSLVAWFIERVDESDPVSRGHSRRVSRLVELAAESIGIGHHDRQRIVQAALLHDVGKVVVPQDLLSRAGPLDAHETSQVRRHAELGGRLLAAIPALAHAAPVARWHHERWDGLGYPGGLKRNEIPFEARFVSVLDAFDAMTSPRAYRAPMSCFAATGELRAHAGAQFDPEIVAIVCALDLEAILQEFEQINPCSLCNVQVAV